MPAHASGSQTPHEARNPDGVLTDPLADEVHQVEALRLAPRHGHGHWSGIEPVTVARLSRPDAVSAIWGR